MRALQAEIAELDKIVSALPQDERDIFDRIFNVSITIGSLVPPEEMYGWIEKLFGSVDAVKHQKIVKVTNLITMEGSLFNELRSRRPIETRTNVNLAEEIEKNIGDPFCKPLTGTPEDAFGRIRGNYSITASNIAKYDGFHGVVIFDEHNPLVFSREGISDYFDVGFQWAQAANAVDAEARYYFFMWNCLWKAGGSLLHGHAQVTLSRDMHYARIEALRRAAVDYKTKYGSSYFDDLYRAHEIVGSAFTRDGVKIMGYLSPIKEKETLFIADSVNDMLKDSVYEVLECFVNHMGVNAFNLVAYMPPIAKVEEDWSDFPIIIRLVDRGDPMNRTSDMGAMELYASSVIASDPMAVTRLLKDRIGDR